MLCVLLALPGGGSANGPGCRHYSGAGLQTQMARSACTDSGLSGPTLGPCERGSQAATCRVSCRPPAESAAIPSQGVRAPRAPRRSYVRRDRASLGWAPVRGHAPLPPATICPARGGAASLPGIELLRGGRWWTRQRTMTVAPAPGSVHWVREEPPCRGPLAAPARAGGTVLGARGSRARPPACDSEPPAWSAGRMRIVAVEGVYSTSPRIPVELRCFRVWRRVTPASDSAHNLKALPVEAL
jgi:hypothetical protein